MSNDLKHRMIDDVLEGRPVSGFDIIDAHTHMGRWQNFNTPMHTAEEMVRLMDRAGIRSCISAAHSSIGPDFRYGNDMVLAAMRQFPGRVFGFCCVNPNYPPEETREELNRCFDQGMIAIKFHPGCHKYRADGEGYRPAWEFAEERGLCVLSHTWLGDPNCGPMIFRQPALDYPSAKIILGHTAYGYEGARICCEMAAELPNVYLDIACSLLAVGLIERMVDGAGAERVLFGTDLPFLDCRPPIGRLAFSKLDDTQLALVLGGNASRLFGI